MKTFDEFLQGEELNESRFLRKTTALLLAGQSKKHGDDAVRHLKSAQQKFKRRGLDTPEERIERLSDGLNDLCEGLISLRKQNGSAVGVSLSAVLMSERSNQQLKDLLKKR
ncbi:MAG: hypothetical protein ACON4W_02985 [Parvibaculales bacterium]